MAKKQKTQEKKRNDLIVLGNPNSPISEQYRAIRTNIQFADTKETPLHTITVTSSGPNEGKSTTSANLAIVFAQAGERVLLVDADLRKPTVHVTFRVANDNGLTTLLTRGRLVTGAARETNIPNLSILPSGPKPPNPSELLGGKRMVELIEEMKEHYDLIIFDTPPVVSVPDAQIMAAKTDGTLLVVRENQTKKETLTKAKQLLTLANARILGAVQNDVDPNKDEGYYYYY